MYTMFHSHHLAVNHLKTIQYLVLPHNVPLASKKDRNMLKCSSNNTIYNLIVIVQAVVVKQSQVQGNPN